MWQSQAESKKLLAPTATLAWPAHTLPGVLAPALQS